MDPIKETNSPTLKASAQKRSNGQGSMYYVTTKQGKRSLKAAINDINGKRRVRTFKRKSDAEDWLAEQKRARQFGENTYATNPKMTVAEFMTGWVESQYGQDQSSTKRFYRNAIKNHIVPTLGNVKASVLTPKAIENLLRDMSARGLGKGTIDSVKSTLSAAFNDAVRLGDLTRNPVKNVKVPNVQSKTTKPIPKADWELIYREAMNDPYSHARIEIGGMVGIRPGEALGLMWKDIDFEEQTLHVERQSQRVKEVGIVLKAVKQKQERTLMLSRATLDILLTHKRYQSLQKASWKVDMDLVFPNTTGNLQDEKSDRSWFKKLCQRAGVPEYELYQLRKTAFTNMASQTDLKTLMQFSGHSQVSTVMGSYVFATNESMKNAIEGMDKLRPVRSN
jgi:integrase